MADSSIEMPVSAVGCLYQPQDAYLSLCMADSSIERMVSAVGYLYKPRGAYLRPDSSIALLISTVGCLYKHRTADMSSSTLISANGLLVQVSKGSNKHLVAYTGNQWLISVHQYSCTAVRSKLCRYEAVNS